MLTAAKTRVINAAKKRITRPPENSSRHYLHEWAKEAASVGSTKDFRVLDVGAGTAPYRELFAQVSYETSDLAQTKKQYGELDYVCDATDMPMADDTFDLVFCSQTLEHVAEPVKALTEMRRVLKPGGQAWLSAPLFYAEHEIPYDYYRYTKYAWRYMAEESGFRVKDISWLEGYFGTVSYQLNVAAKSLPVDRPTRAVMHILARRFAARDMESKFTRRGMCKNYRVTLVKP
ncbi:MAG: class I SAM-dependent methyltransferase [Janibacter sp.]